MISREIGGYLQLEHYHGNPIQPDAVALNCGRNCLAYLAELRGIETVWLPDWLCHSVRDVCVREGVAVRKYEIGPDMLPMYDFEVGNEEWLYLVDYYGQLRSLDVDEALSRSGGRLIVDETHGLYRPAWEDADTLCTCRKWLGVPDGAYLITYDGARLARELPRCESRERMRHILGRVERPASEFLADHRAADAGFALEPVSYMSSISESLIAAADHETIRKRRCENWDVLHEALGGMNLLGVRKPAVPFMYPLRVEDAIGMRGRLADTGVYVPTLWPEVIEESTSGKWARSHATHLLPLPVDQRYGTEEMEYVVMEMLQCF